MNNIEQFNQIVVWSLAKLYAEFPNPIILQKKDFDAEMNLDGINPNTFGSTVEFLEREGFITIGSTVDGGTVFFFVVLTMKGLNILDSIPLSVKNEQNIGQQTQSLVKTGFKEAGKEVLITVVSEIISAATR